MAESAQSGCLPESEVPELRVRCLNDGTVRASADWVLYWMTGFRRTRWSFSFDRAVEWARELGKPLVLLEALRTDYQWASDRFHAFILEGMLDNLRSLEAGPVGYYPYVERKKGQGSGLFEALADRAAVVVTDDFPSFFLPRMIEAASNKVSVRLEAIDSNGVLPLRAAPKVYARAYDFRRFLQKELPEHFDRMPRSRPLETAELEKSAARELDGIEKRWPPVDEEDLTGVPELIADLPLDHTVSKVDTRGGSVAAVRCWRSFLRDSLAEYGEGRNDPDADNSSGISPYLHFGHISPHQIFAELVEDEEWTPLSIASSGKGQREGWWGMSASAEAFLDQLITWRELGYNMSSKTKDYDQYGSLPDWALQTLEDHRDDDRPEIYSQAELEAAETGDDIWNAAQRQLVLDGRIHNYLRMLWGKKIYQWSETPEDALDTMVHLNNKYALDGRNPNSYSGIFWCLGRYDRAWGPERSIFGKIRYMTSDSTRRKLKLDRYLEQYGPEAAAKSQLDLFSDSA